MLVMRHHCGPCLGATSKRRDQVCAKSYWRPAAASRHHPSCPSYIPPCLHVSPNVRAASRLALLICIIHDVTPHSVLHDSVHDMTPRHRWTAGRWTAEDARRTTPQQPTPVASNNTHHNSRHAAACMQQHVRGSRWCGGTEGSPLASPRMAGGSATAPDMSHQDSYGHCGAAGQCGTFPSGSMSGAAPAVSCALCTPAALSARDDSRAGRGMLACWLSKGR